MSEWHLEWQERFPEENREIVLENNGEKHRADVLINNTVIEFQHSSLSSYEFDRRNQFYLSLGYNVIWIFDVANLYDTGSISLLNNSETKYKWRRPYKTFDNFNPKDKKIELYFQLSYEDEEFLQEFEESAVNLIKIDWIAPSGIERFASNNYYGPEHIVGRFIHNEQVIEEKTLCHDDLYDILFPHYSKDHTTFLYGCPLSKTHYAITSTIDTPEKDYDKYMPCELCEFRGSVDRKMACNQRIRQVNIPANAKILDIKRTETGQIYSITVSNDDVSEIKIKNSIPPLGDTILSAWKKINPRSVIILKNIRTGYFVKIAKRQKTMLESTGKCYGYLSRDQYKYPENESEIYYFNKPEWICVWHK